MRSLAFFSMAGMLVTACVTAPAAKTNADEIVDGTPTSDHPAVGVVHQTVARSFCTGTLVAPDIVLTAGHCVEGEEKIDAFFLGPGRAVADSATDPATVGMTRYEVAEQVAYPGFDYFYSCPNQALDVALLRLAAPIADVQPVKLGAPPGPTAECVTVGYGTHPTSAGDEFLEKRAATVRISEVRETSLDIGAVDGIASHGDSGGPLFCDGVLVATTSCQPDWPLDAITYGNVAAGLPWIMERIARWTP